jgi:GrpB-like predicted nucleotidyltransferase (UPF0157 family)
MPVKIILADYNPDRPRQFEAEKAQLLAVIGDHVADIQHIGSTAVPGLAPPSR